ncbi:TPA: helix-turn-helix domain-containing protein [Salmonella enterica]|nr:helix-turn-helix domain-containing protein [Salmonella enterica]HDY3838061.1 helix-turn-helix domain-containing protein [Salmonella enterica]
MSSCALQIHTGSPLLGAQAGHLIGAGVSRQQVAIIYDVGLSTLYRKFPATN